jgi:hypothetical protein
MYLERAKAIEALHSITIVKCLLAIALLIKEEDVLFL